MLWNMMNYFVLKMVEYVSLIGTIYFEIYHPKYFIIFQPYWDNIDMSFPFFKNKILSYITTLFEPDLLLFYHLFRTGYFHIFQPYWNRIPQYISMSYWNMILHIMRYFVLNKVQYISLIGTRYFDIFYPFLEQNTSHITALFEPDPLISCNLFRIVYFHVFQPYWAYLGTKYFLYSRHIRTKSSNIYQPF